MSEVIHKEEEFRKPTLIDLSDYKSNHRCTKRYAIREFLLRIGDQEFSTVQLYKAFVANSDVKITLAYMCREISAMTACEWLEGEMEGKGKQNYFYRITEEGREKLIEFCKREH